MDAKLSIYEPAQYLYGWPFRNKKYCKQDYISLHNSIVSLKNLKAIS